MPKTGPDSPENRPGLLKNYGICIPKRGRYDCIFIQKRLGVCINIQSGVKVFRHLAHSYSDGRNYSLAYDSHGTNRRNRPPRYQP